MATRGNSDLYALTIGYAHNSYQALVLTQKIHWENEKRNVLPALQNLLSLDFLQSLFQRILVIRKVPITDTLSVIREVAITDTLSIISTYSI